MSTHGDQALSARSAGIGAALSGFDTPIDDLGGVIAGPWRHPRQMLQAQSYGDHATIHDEATAQALGFRSGTIEGPTHCSQFAPLCALFWGRIFYERGCISVHFRQPAFDGDQLRAFADRPGPGARLTRIWLTNREGVAMAEGTASVNAAQTELDARLADLKPLQHRIILKDVEIGMRTQRRPVVMDFGQAMGTLYPFTLDDKLAVITEPSPWNSREQGRTSPWGRAVIPFEMISVLLKYTDENPPFPVPSVMVSLIADQEIRLVDGPLFVGEHYELDQEVVAFSGSRRTESMWIRTRLFRSGTDSEVANMLINQASLKETLPDYGFTA